MKLRFRNNTLRLRLNRREAETIAAGSALKEQVSFPEGSTFSYVLESGERQQPEASFQQGVIRIAAPAVALQNWVADRAIGIYFELPANGAMLKIAIEKDLECVDGPLEERDPDAFDRGDCNSC